MLIETTLGVMDTAELEMTEGVEQIAETPTTGPAELRWVEYRHEGEIVHRSAHITAKGPLFKLALETIGD